MKPISGGIVGGTVTKLLIFATLVLTPHFVDAGQLIRESSQDQESSKDKRPAEGIQDNSFFIEEAYNQEAGVVQHIFTAFGSVNRLRGSDERVLDLSFTQEWPIFSQTHQFSYTIPYAFIDTGETENGLGDIQLDYRLQLFTETDNRPAVAPRFSIILPTGDADDGLGNDTTGFQFNLPVSKVVGDRWTVHGNAGLTVLPDVQGQDLTNYNLGASVIYAVSPTFNLMLEAVADWEEEPGELSGKESSFSAILSPGFRYAVNLANETQLVVGLAAPIGLSGDAPDYGVFIYCSFEHSFLRR